MDIRRLQSFLVLARELHFGRAATTLYISQPALSQQIKSLEEELGAALLVRGSHGVHLTAAGDVLLAEGDRLVRDVDTVMEQVRLAAAGRRGRLRVQYTRSWPGAGSHDLVTGFRAENPGVVVDVETGWTQLNIELLLKDETDVAFVRPPLVDFPQLASAQIGSDVMTAVLPPGHRLAARSVISRSDLSGESVVLWPRAQGPGYRDSIVSQIWGDAVPQVLEEPDDDHILAAVAAGAGIGILGAERIRVLPHPDGVEIRPFADPQPQVQLAIAWRRQDGNPAVDRFVEFARRFSGPAVADR